MMKNIKRNNFNLVNNLFELKKLKKENREIKIYNIFYFMCVIYLRAFAVSVKDCILYKGRGVFHST